jgi:hypothetical protein
MYSDGNAVANVAQKGSDDQHNDNIHHRNFWRFYQNGDFNSSQYIAEKDTYPFLLNDYA